MKRSGLGRGGVGARAFVDRGRVSSAQSLGASRKALAADTALSRSVGRQMGWAEDQSLENALRTSFKAARPARAQWCARCPRGSRRAQCWHHFLPQQAIRAHMLEVARRDALEPRAVRRRLKVLLADDRNLVALCHDHHRELEAWMCGAGGRDGWQVPDEAVAFAAGLGTEWRERLVRLYPGTEA